MGQESPKQGGDLFIVDNSDQDWKVRRYLSDWADLADSFDIATGYFEIGALLALDSQWQKLDHRLQSVLAAVAHASHVSVIEQRGSIERRFPNWTLISPRGRGRKYPRFQCRGARAVRR